MMDTASLWSENNLFTSSSPLSHILNDNHLTPQTSRSQSRWLYNASPGWNIADTNNVVKPNNLAAQHNGTSNKSFSSLNGINNNVNGNGNNNNNNNNNFDVPTEYPSSISSARNATAQDFLQRYKQLKSLEGYKNELIEDLLCRYEYLTEQYKKLCDDHDRECEYNRGSQRREKNLQDNLRRLQTHLDQDPFILVLINGDHMMFNDHLLSKGEAGGREAAVLLNAKIIDRISLMFPHLPADIRIVTRIYADVKSLGAMCYKAGLVERAEMIEDFTRGFTAGQQLFDFVDVGSVKDHANVKILDLLKLHMNDHQCRQTFLGFFNDNNDNCLSEELRSNQYTRERITLLEGIPFEQSMRNFDCETVKLGGLWREERLDISAQQPAFENLSLSQSNGVAVPAISYQQNSSPSVQLSEIDVREAKDFIPTPFQARAASVSTESSTKQSPASTWASAAAKAPILIAPPTPAATAATVTVASKEPLIPRNRKGQRVDPLIKHDKVEVDRVKKLKMCNVHFLRCECPYGDSCSHVHQYKPTSAELQTLRLVARMAPCMHGSECDDTKCIYGHVCPAPEGRDGKDCIFGDQCRFPPELHRIDRQIVKVIRV